MSEEMKQFLELHEKLEKLDAERDQLRADLDKAQRPFWKNPALITALITGIGSLFVSTGFTWDNIASLRDRDEKVVENEKVELQANSAIFSYLHSRQDEVEGLCQLYADAVIASLPKYQQVKVKKFMQEHGHTVQVPEVPSEPEIAGPPTVVAPLDSLIQVAKEAPPDPKDIYMAIQDQAKMQQDVDVDKLKLIDEIAKKHRQAVKE